MAPWSSTPQVEVQIRFDNDDRSKATVDAPTYVGDEYITGAATFSLRKNYGGIRYKIAIKGTSDLH